ncbi:MAG: EamA family transporter [Firmicutes bacterium]|nr:EamA family transporter [Bacillota bacterium]
MDSGGKALAGTLMALGAGVCWGTSGMFIRVLNAWGVTSFQAAMFRGGMGFLIMLLIMLISRKESLKVGKFRDLALLFFVGVAGLSTANLAYCLSVKVNPLAVAVVLMYAAPIFSTIGAAIFFKERITLRKVIALACAFSGCVVMSGLLGGSSFRITAIGLIAGILSALGYAIYIVGSRAAVQRNSTAVTTLYMTMFYALGTIPFALSDGPLPGKLAGVLPIFFLVLFGLVCTAVPYTLYAKALQRIEVGKASVLAFSEPATATIIGILIYREAFTVSTGLALGLILISIIIMNKGGES